jgi:hypothetical protein
MNLIKPVVNFTDVEAEMLADAIKYPRNAEWYSGYGAIIRNAVSAYRHATPARRKIFKKNPKEFIDEYDLSPGSDDDHDYISPIYAYLDIEIIKKIMKSKAFSNISPAMKHYLIKVFLSKNDPQDIEMVLEETFENVMTAWQNAYGDIGLEKAYLTGKVNLETKKVFDGIKPKVIDWEALGIFYRGVFEI